jgi:hypothetical protein
MQIDNDGNFAYISKNGMTRKTFLHINEFHYEMDIKDEGQPIKEFSLVDKNTVHIKYINTGDEIVEKDISLNPDAEQVKQKLEADALEAKNMKAIQELLHKNNITSVAQLSEIFDSANKFENLTDSFNEMAHELQKAKLDITSLKEANSTLTTEKENLGQDKFNLETNMQNIRTGITR